MSLLSWQNILGSRQIAADLEEKLANQGEVFRTREESVTVTFSYQANGNHATELSTVGHVILERHWKSTFDFTEILNNYWWKRGTVCQILRFISQFSLKLYIQF